jgi:hypothetical protein
MYEHTGICNYFTRQQKHNVLKIYTDLRIWIGRCQLGSQLFSLLVIQTVVWKFFLRASDFVTIISFYPATITETERLTSPTHIITVEILKINTFIAVL